MAMGTLMVPYVPYKSLGMRLQAINLRNCPVSFQCLFVLSPHSFPYSTDLFYVVSDKIMMFDPFVDCSREAIPMGFGIHKHCAIAARLRNTQ